MSYRSDFPIFAAKPDLIYLDSAASTQKPAVMIEAINQFYRTGYANVHRGVYPLAVQSDQAFSEARQIVANFINAASDKEVVFTRSATEGLNLLASCLSTDLKPGDEIILSTFEHHANLVPWQQVATKTGAKLIWIDYDHEGNINLEDLRNKLSELTRIVTLSHCSNVLGRFLPVQQVKEIIDQQGSSIRFILDTAQSIAHLPIDVQTLGCDFLVFSGHKIYGPSGIGVLWGREEFLQTLPPYQTGGDMIRTVSIDHSTWNDLPWKFEAGTPNIEGAIGLATSLSYIQQIGLNKISQHISNLAAQLRSELDSLSEVQVIGDPDPKSGLISFTVKEVHPHDLADLLGEHQVCIRGGHHCAAPLHAHLGLTASCRVSLGMYNTEADIQQFVRVLKEVISDLTHA